jgi:hypothetical protein
MLKAGYHIQIASWENDADHPNTTTTVVQTGNEVHFYAKWMQLFKTARDGGNDDEHFGNMPEHDWTEAIGNRVLELTNNLRREYGLDEFEDTYHISDVLYEIFGPSEYCTYRVFERMRVYHIPFDIPEYEVPDAQ